MQVTGHHKQVVGKKKTGYREKQVAGENKPTGLGAGETKRSHRKQKQTCVPGWWGSWGIWGVAGWRLGWWPCVSVTAGDVSLVGWGADGQVGWECVSVRVSGFLLAWLYPGRPASSHQLSDSDRLAVLQNLGYTGRAELFAMYACFLGHPNWNLQIDCPAGLYDMVLRSGGHNGRILQDISILIHWKRSWTPYQQKK